jgi:hypothetical protein
MWPLIAAGRATCSACCASTTIAPGSPTAGRRLTRRVRLIVDTQPYPPYDTTQCAELSSAYPTCISNPQVQSELQRLITSDKLPSAGPASASELSANAPIYFVILPVEVCETFGVLCTGNKNCGWHGTFVDRRGDNVLYAPHERTGRPVSSALAHRRGLDAVAPDATGEVPRLPLRCFEQRRST